MSKEVTTVEMSEPEKAGKPVAKAMTPKVIAAKVGMAAVSVAIIAGFISVASIYGFRETPEPEPQARMYHLAVEERLWDFAPTGMDSCSGTHLEHSDSGSIFTVNDPAASLIGSKYWRRQFVAYTDGSFLTAQRVPREWEHLGSLGPVLRVHAGETLRVRIRNRSRFPASFSVHGLSLSSVSFFDDSEGSSVTNPTGPGSTNAPITAILHMLGFNTPESSTSMSDGFSSGFRTVTCSETGAVNGACSTLEGSIGQHVPPGRTVEYAFIIPQEAGPAQGETSSVARMYQSLSYQGHDVGLTGFVVITARPSGKNPSRWPSPARPADVSHEAAQLYSVNNENDSPYLGLNLLEFVYRGRVAAGTALNTIERLAARPREPVYPVHSTAAMQEVLAALYNQAAALASEDTTLAPSGGLIKDSIEASDPAIRALLGAVGVRVTDRVAVPALYGLTLNLEFYPADATRSNMYFVDARGYVSVYGRILAELAVESFMLPGLEAEASWDAGTFEESNLLHAVNGRLYCNLDGLSFPFGATVRWYTAVAGTEVDIHAVHWHGQTLLLHGHRTDSIQLLPRQVVTADMYAHSPGTWLLHCHVTDHIHAGMIVLYTVLPASTTTSVQLARPGPPTTAAPIVEEKVPTLIAKSLNGRYREYWVAAETANWTYVDEHVVQHNHAQAPYCGGADFEALATALNGSATWSKVIYRGYTDATYTTPVPRSAAWEHLGILGPVLRAEVGDIVKVHFKNNADRAFSLHPHGVAYPKSGEGAPYQDGTAGNADDTGDDMVQPGQTWTYTWWVPESAGPGPSDPSSVPFLYHGHVHEDKDENTGLVGVLLVTRKGAARVPGGVGDELRPKDVDRELVVLSKAFDEANAGGAQVRHSHGRRELAGAASSEDIYSIFFTVNGKAACSLPGMDATSGQRVRWYMTSLGNEIDLHHMSVTGHTMTQWGRRVTGVALSPGTMFAVDMVAGVPGDWLLTSNVRHHIKQGLVSSFHVDPLPGPAAQPSPPAGAQTRTYYLAAENIMWDYTPSGEDRCAPAEVRASVKADFFEPLVEEKDQWGVGRFDLDGTDLNGYPTDGRIFVGRGLENGTTIGRMYRKAVYVGYSDDSFSQVLYRPGSTTDSALRLHGPAGASRGILGPTLRAGIGDTLVVVFQNKLDFPVNFNIPHGPVLSSVRVRAPGTTVWIAVPGSTSVPTAASFALPTGWIAQYTYRVPVSAGPAALDSSTIAWVYKSTVELSHLHAGLVGGVIVSTTASALYPAAGTHGAHREYILAWYISNENESPFLEKNIEEKVPNHAGLDIESETFVESNLMHAVNGRLFCNLDGLTARVGETVRLHMLGLGAELDMHTPQIHGALLRISKGRDSAGASVTEYAAAAVGLHPGVMQTVDFTASSVGSWLVECGVNDHWGAGMRASMVVAE